MNKIDVAIIGAGIVGLSIGVKLLEAKPGIKVLILEKEKKLALHASGRNSGVIHAGFYYSPDSLKAKFCKDGNKQLKDLCKEFQIPYLEIGKVVVARNEEENFRLETLANRARINNVDIEIFEQDRLKDFEPLAKTCERFLWSPTTAVTDPIEVTNAILKKYISLGGEIQFDYKSSISMNCNQVKINKVKFEAKQIVNAAGSYSVSLAKGIGLAHNLKMVPFKGTYIASDSMSSHLKTLVYPVPHAINPFLGVHFTKTINNTVKIGPTAIPVFGKEQYDKLSQINLEDSIESFSGLFSMAIRDTHDIPEILKSEIPKIFKKLLIREAATLVPTVTNFRDWRKIQPGIRAQLVDSESGEMMQDFLVLEKENSTHVLNVVSPGWTSALSFSEYLVKHFLSKKI